MKNLSIVFFSLLTLSFTVQAYEQPENPWTVGGTIGVATHKVGTSYTYSPPDASRAAVYKSDREKTVSMTLLGSYSILDSLLVEVQFATTLGDSTMLNTVDKPTSDKDNLATTDMKVSSYAAGTYAVYKLGNEAYFKARLGLGVSSAKFKTGFASQQFTDFGLSYGFSVGQKFGPGSLEFMYMRYPDVKVSASKFSHRFDTTHPNPDNTASNKNLVSSFNAKRRQQIQYFTIGYVYSF